MPSRQKSHLLENTAASYNKFTHWAQVNTSGFLRSCPNNAYLPTESSQQWVTRAGL